MDDIAALILDDHAQFRRGFARLGDARYVDGGDLAEVRAVWEPLALHLEVHAAAEEEILYPVLLRRGGDDADDETEDAIGDHNKIRDAIAEAARHELGTAPWWEAVGAVRRENTEHLGEEEDEVLPDFRQHTGIQARADLGRAWLRFYGEHPQGRGLRFADRDPAEYVHDHQQ